MFCMFHFLHLIFNSFYIFKKHFSFSPIYFKKTVILTFCLFDFKIRLLKSLSSMFYKKTLLKKTSYAVFSKESYHLIRFLFFFGLFSLSILAGRKQTRLLFKDTIKRLNTGKSNQFRDF